MKTPITIAVVLLLAGGALLVLKGPLQSTLDDPASKAPESNHQESAGKRDGSRIESPEEKRLRQISKLKEREKQLETLLAAELEKFEAANPEAAAYRKEGTKYMELLRDPEFLLKRNMFDSWAEGNKELATKARQLALLRAYQALLADDSLKEVVSRGLPLQTKFLNEDLPLVNNAEDVRQDAKLGWENAKMDLGDPGILPQEIGVRLRENPNELFAWAEESLGDSDSIIPQVRKDFLDDWARKAVLKTAYSLVGKDAMPVSVWHIKADLNQVRKGIWELTAEERKVARGKQ